MPVSYRVIGPMFYHHVPSDNVQMSHFQPMSTLQNTNKNQIQITQTSKAPVCAQAFIAGVAGHEVIVKHKENVLLIDSFSNWRVVFDTRMKEMLC